MSSSPFRLLHVGLGNRGRMWSEVMDRRTDVVPSGYVDVSPERLALFQESHPDVPIFLAALDERLNERGYIVPGLGDAGDRQFGTG